MSLTIQGNVVEIVHGTTIMKADGVGSYNGTRFTYRDDKGKVGEQNFHEKTLGYNNLQESLDALNEKDDFTMIKEKGDAGYWNVKSIAKGHNGNAGGGASPVTGNQVRATGGGKYKNDSYETNDMRNFRQRSITRIASLKTAIEFMVATKKSLSTADTLKLALAFEEHVLREDPIDVTTIVDDTSIL